MFLSTRRNQRIARFNRPQRKVDDKFSSEPQGKSRLNTTEQTYQHIYLWKFKQNQVRFVTWKMHKIFILIDDGFCLHYFGNCTTQFLGMSSIISTHCHNLCAHLHQFVPQKSRHPSCDSPKLKIARHCSEPRNPQSLHHLLMGPVDEPTIDCWILQIFAGVDSISYSLEGISIFEHSVMCELAHSHPGSILSYDSR